MAALAQGAIARPIVPHHSELEPGVGNAIAHRRLTCVFEASIAVPFDDESRFVFFGDCHRGDNSCADVFARNEELFLRALRHYHAAGYTYVEVGDGDELYQNSLSAVLQAHEQTFDMLRQSDDQGRLHLIAGNHDTTGLRRRFIDKAGILAHEGLLLRHVNSGQQVFVVHGHQADLVSDQFRIPGRFFVRHFW